MSSAPFSWVVMMAVSFCIPAYAETHQESIPSAGQGGEAGMSHVIVQIGGRYCEYHREEVEGALRRFPEVQEVKFLNDHGTVLVRYQVGAVPPAQLAASVEMALASGIGCKAWVDLGGAQHAKS
ncbi:hypothetical protein ACO9S2_09845 [Nitrospira sp. NS4]|uniref:hypothetical protein n=1 Tax=Nitrospira sp. NS4 TaxID=3414498 RepID=UPI003C2C6FA4